MLVAFDLPQHKSLLTCATEVLFSPIKCAGGIVPIAGWIDLAIDVANIGYTASNSKYFIEDLKSTIIPQDCQDQDSYKSNTTVSQTDVTDYWSDIDDRFIYATRAIRNGRMPMGIIPSAPHLMMTASTGV